jgi:cytochrome P450
VTSTASVLPAAATLPNAGIAYEPLAPEDWQDPYPAYRRLRDEAPLHWAPGAGVYCVSRYEDVAQVLRRPDEFPSSRAFNVLLEGSRPRLGLRDGFELARFLLRTRTNPLAILRAGRRSDDDPAARGSQPDAFPNLITLDPPRHDRLRSIVNRGFTPRRIQRWEPRIREITDACVDQLRRRPRFDVVSGLAIPLPVTVIAEVLGIDAGRREDFKRWSTELAVALTGSQRSETIGTLLRSMGELGAYLRRAARLRRRHPEDDLISVLVDPRHGEALSPGDVVNFVTLLLIAGNETTTNLIGNAVSALLDHPEQLELVRADPALIPALVEETLRYESPVQVLFRRADRETELAGTRIPAEARLAVLLGSANRDEREFPDPDRFDVRREPKAHVGFGLGVHFCLGASLARLEARIALEALVPELTARRRSDEPHHWIDSYLLRGPSRLELVRR